MGEDQMKMKQGQQAPTTSKYQHGCLAMWLKTLIIKKLLDHRLLGCRQTSLPSLPPLSQMKWPWGRGEKKRRPLQRFGFWRCEIMQMPNVLDNFFDTKNWSTQSQSLAVLCRWSFVKTPCGSKWTWNLWKKNEKWILPFLFYTFWTYGCVG